MNTKYSLFKKIVAVICTIVTLVLVFSVSAFAATEKDKAIIIIPGIAGSKLYQEKKVLGITTKDQLWPTLLSSEIKKLECNIDGISVNTIVTNNKDTGGAWDTCSKFYNKINKKYKNSYDVIFFSYDWRMSCAKAVTDLQTYIDKYSKVILIAHSMGGLVASKCLVSANNRKKVEKFISIGTPYLGSHKGIYVMETGRFVELAIDNNTTYAPLSPVLKEVACNFPSVYELLPTKRMSVGTNGYIYDGTNYLRSFTDYWNFLKNRFWGIYSATVSSPKSMFKTATDFHDSLIVGGVHISNRSDLVKTYKICGIGEDTIYNISYKKNGTIDHVWVDDFGDKTVTIDSALNIDNTGSYSRPMWSFNATHTGLLKNDDVINKVIEIIDGNISSDDWGQLTTKSINSIIGQKREYIYIMAYNVSELSVFTENKEQLVCEDDLLYRQDKDGNLEKVGSVWSLGDNSYQLVMKDGKYKVDIEKGQLKNSELKIDYVSNRKIVKSVAFNKIDSVKLNVENFTSKAIKCLNNNKLLQPSKVLSQAELDSINNNDF